MKDIEDIDQKTLSILLHSLSDVQNAIRAYDVKAQIVSIGFIFALGLVATVGDLAPKETTPTIIFVLASWIFGVIPIALFGYVLYPSRSHAPKLGAKVCNLQRSYYLLNERHPTLDDYLNAFEQSDWKVELAYEVHKNSLLRDMKRKRFVWALNIAGVSFSLLFLLQLFRAVGVQI